MDIWKTGSFLGRLYVGVMAFVWAVLLILGGGFLVSLGAEPFKTRGMVMVAIGVVIVLITALRFAHAARAVSVTGEKRPVEDAQPSFDADEAIARYLAQKGTEAPAAGGRPVDASSTIVPVGRPTFGRRGSA